MSDSEAATVSMHRHAIRRDQADWAAFADREADRLTRYAFLLTGNSDEAQDIVQAVLLRLLSRHPGATNQRAYAMRAILNEVRYRHRRAAVLRRLIPRIAPPPARDTSDDLAESAALREAMSRLPDRQRAAVVLRYFEDKYDQEIAEILGCAMPTVRSLIHRALSALKLHISKETK